MASTAATPFSTMSFLFLVMFFSSLFSKTTASDMSIISLDEKRSDKLMSMHEAWMVKHGKSYNALGEKDKRFEIFKDNLRYIEEQNALSNRTYKLGLSRFADLTNDEYRNMYLGTRPDPKRRLSKVRSDRYEPRLGDSLPDSVDWRDKGAVAPVKDQGDCGKSSTAPPFSETFKFNISSWKRDSTACLILYY